MPIIVPTSPFAAQSEIGAGWLAKNNLIFSLDADVTAGFENIKNWNENKKVSGTTATVVIDLKSTQTFNYIGVRGSVVATVSVSDDNSDYTTVATISCSKVALERIPVQDKRYIKLEITGAYDLKVVAAGTLNYIQAQQDGFNTPDLTRMIMVQNEISQKGIFMGRTIVNEATEFPIEFKNVSENYAKNEMLAIQKHIELYPVFFVWRKGERPVFAWMDKSAKGATYNKLKYIKQKFMMRGVVES